MIKSEPNLYNIALTFLPGIGDINAKKIFSCFRNTEELFLTKISDLEKCPGIGKISAQKIFATFQTAVDLAKKELEFIYKNDINVVSYSEENYPYRLRECADSPFVLYHKGNINFNKEKIIAIIGTRNPTKYGNKFCDKFIDELSEKYPDSVIISGLAYGIDIISHKAAIKNNIETWAVLGNGLASIYPAAHKKTADIILEKNGAIISDFPHDTKPDAQNFPMRNRIVAGLCDAVIVVESGIKGGSMITATIANSYNRDVFALPGNIDAPQSQGCNKLIKTNKAQLIESINDLEYILGWDTKIDTKKQKVKIDKTNLNCFEVIIVDAMEKTDNIDIDVLIRETDLDINTINLTLLELEMKEIIESLPGKRFCLKL